MKKKLIAAILTATTIVNANIYGEMEVQVKNVQKVLKTVTIRKAEKECWTEIVQVRVDENEKTAGNQLFGALLGGALGSQFGGGSGKKIATVAGAVIGANTMGDTNGTENIYEEREIEKCKTKYIPRTEERFSHYVNFADFGGKEIKKRSGIPLETITIRYDY
jgi:uncharacterized protein YcfJ